MRSIAFSRFFFSQLLKRHLSFPQFIFNTKNQLETYWKQSWVYFMLAKRSFMPLLDWIYNQNGLSLKGTDKFFKEKTFQSKRVFQTKTIAPILRFHKQKYCFYCKPRHISHINHILNNRHTSSSTSDRHIKPVLMEHRKTET